MVKSRWAFIQRLSTGPEYLLLKHAPYHHAPEHRPTDEDAVADEVNDGVADVSEAHGVVEG